MQLYIHFANKSKKYNFYVKAVKIRVLNIFDHHQSEKSAYGQCSYSSGNASYVIPVPMGSKERSSDCTCLFSSGRKRAM